MLRRNIPLVITFVSGLVMIIPYYVRGLESKQDIFLDWFKILQVFAYILGVASLVISNGKKIQSRAPGWGHNVVLLVCLFVTLGFGIGAGNFEAGSLSYYIFIYIFTPLSATMFSLLAFFIASAAFRAFKAKSVEATLLLTSACIVMLGRVPPGEMLWRHIPFIGHYEFGAFIDTWMMGTFNAAGQRAILLGSSIGLISISLKILLGVERSYLGSD